MIFIKHVRNKIKSQYEKDSKCYICESSEKLEFHHLLCVSVETKKILLKKGYTDYPSKDDPNFEDLVWQIARDSKIRNPDYFYTLCKKCHIQLHKIFGQNYVAWKPVEKYIEKQRSKEEAK